MKQFHTVGFKPVMSPPQHTSHSNGRQEISTRSARTGVRSRSSEEPQQPHVGNYRLLKTIGKGNFAKVKLARHILTGREVSWTHTQREGKLEVITPEKPEETQFVSSSSCFDKPINVNSTTTAQFVQYNLVVFE